MNKIKDYEDQIAMLKNAAAQSWKNAEERKRLIEEAVKLEIEVMHMKNIARTPIFGKGVIEDLIPMQLNGSSDDELRGYLKVYWDKPKE